MIYAGFVECFPRWRVSNYENSTTDSENQLIDMRYFRYRLMVFCTLLLAAHQGQAGDLADFTLPDMDGKSHKLSDFRGKWVLVNYWATWCPPCREELPELEVFHANGDGEAVVIGVNTEDIGKEPLREFVEEQFISYPILVAGADPGPEQRVGPIPGLPTSYLVAPDGSVVARQVGPVTAEAIRAFIDAYKTRPEG